MRYILDTDIGSDVDDAFALLSLLYSVPDRLIGVTTCYGCPELRAKIAKKIVNSMGIDIPVVAGERFPIYSPDSVWLTGKEGEGVLTREEKEQELSLWGIKSNAPEFIVEQVLKYPGEVVLICIAPLTNVAKAFRLEPELGRYLKAIYFMGGGISFPQEIYGKPREGKVYHSEASHNIRCDLGAAKEVLNTDVDIYFITNDVTSKTKFGRRKIERFFKKAKNEVEKIIAGMLRVWLNYRSEIFGFPVRVTYLHDVLTVVEALGLGFVDYVNGEIDILDDSSTYFRVLDGKRKFSYKVDRDSFVRWFYQLLGI